MGRELALMISMSAVRASVELANLVPLLKEHGEGARDEPVKQAIASAIYEIGLVTDQVFEQYPELGLEAEARLNRYGRSYF